MYSLTFMQSAKLNLPDFFLSSFNNKRNFTHDTQTALLGCRLCLINDMCVSRHSCPSVSSAYLQVKPDLCMICLLQILHTLCAKHYPMSQLLLAGTLNINNQLCGLGRMCSSKYRIWAETWVLGCTTFPAASSHRVTVNLHQQCGISFQGMLNWTPKIIWFICVRAFCLKVTFFNFDLMFSNTHQGSLFPLFALAAVKPCMLLADWYLLSICLLKKIQYILGVKKMCLCYQAAICHL